ncbi:MAG TPA: ribbon-helix-helix protein, CopG family [Stellaceae bacterium]|nr:ribbon-helix-helix protein, CopG family [Stellaceae bacterium]
MPDDQCGESHVSLRVPDGVIEAFDKLAEMLDRPRSWVLLRALRRYLDDEGAEIAADAESLAQLDRGEGAPLATIIDEVGQITRGPSSKR